MAYVSDILRQKNSDLVTSDAFLSVHDAVGVMNNRHVGAVLVMDADRDLLGIFTERDVLTRVVARDLSPRETIVGEVMTVDVLCCREDTDLGEVAQIMKDRRIRHIPVRDRNLQILGMISIGDINAYHVSAKQATIDNMTDYIYGRS